MSMRFLRAIALCAAVVAPVPLYAQASGYPIEPNFYQYASVRQPWLDSVKGSDYAAMYLNASLLTSVTRNELPNDLDLAYGNHPKQRLDIYRPATKIEKAPVVLFLHGGGKQEGDKAHYGFVARHLSPHGIVVAVASYRLVSKMSSVLGDEELRFPAQEDDTKAAIIWLYRNIASYGGDPTRVFVMGHSNGASLSSFVGVDRTWLTRAGVPSSIIRGVGLLSGGAGDVTRATRGAMGDRYCPTPEEKRLATPVLNVGDPAPAFVIQYGEKEASAERSQDVARLTQALQAKHVQIKSVVEPKAEHTLAVLAMGDASTATFKAILELVTGAN
jgi:acetyl esterase/lipase